MSPHLNPLPAGERIKLKSLSSFGEKEIIGISLSLEGQGEGEIEAAYEKDRERQQKIEGLGIQFLRVNDLDVKRNMPGVLSVIEQWIEEHIPDP